jgi:hypothetical protein
VPPNATAPVTKSWADSLRKQPAPYPPDSTLRNRPTWFSQTYIRIVRESLGHPRPLAPNRARVFYDEKLRPLILNLPSAPRELAEGFSLKELKHDGVHGPSRVAHVLSLLPSVKVLWQDVFLLDMNTSETSFLTISTLKSLITLANPDIHSRGLMTVEYQIDVRRLWIEGCRASVDLGSPTHDREPVIPNSRSSDGQGRKHYQTCVQILTSRSSASRH